MIFLVEIECAYHWEIECAKSLGSQKGKKKDVCDYIDYICRQKEKSSSLQSEVSSVE